MVIGRRVLGLERAPGRLLAVEVTPTAVSQAGVINLPHDSLERMSLKPALRGMGMKTGIVHLVEWDSEQTHRTLLLPPMTATERSLFLERELAREEGGAKAVGSKILRRVEDGARKDEVLVVAASRELLEQRLASFIAAGLTPRLVTTAPLALVKAAQVLSPNPLDRPTIVCHWGFSGLTLAVVFGGVLTLARQIPHIVAPGLDPLEWATTEIQRSVLHYTQIPKGGRVEQILFANGEAAVERFFSPPNELEARLGVPVLNLTEALRSLLPERVEEEAGIPAGAFLPAFGAALLGAGEVPNLLPRAIGVERRSRLTTRTAVPAACLLALLLGGSFWATNREAAGLRHTLERQQLAKQRLQSELGEAERIEGERQRVRGWIRLLTNDPLGGPPLADALKEVSRLAPDRLRLERLVISKDERGYGMKLGGSVKHTDLAEAQLAFNQLYFGLRDSPFFYDVTFLKGGGPAVSGAASTAEPQLAFELALRLKEMR